MKKEPAGESLPARADIQGFIPSEYLRGNAHESDQFSPASESAGGGYYVGVCAVRKDNVSFSSYYYSLKRSTWNSGRNT